MDELKIIQYLDDEMFGEELRNFEEEIRINPELAEEIEKYRKIQELAVESLAGEDEQEREPDRQAEGAADPPPEEDEMAGREVQEEISGAVEDFKRDPASMGDLPPGYLENLKQAERSYMEGRNKGSSIRVIRRIWYSAAAVAVLAVVSSILVFRPFAKMSADEIYAQYFTPFHKTGKILELARADNDFLFATEVYEAGDYERAAVLFEMLADSSGTRSWSMFYAGSSYMLLNQTDKAIALFQAVLQEGDLELAPEAHWQLALCHIRRGEPDLAGVHLEVLLDESGYRKDAGRILRFLK